MGVTGFNSVSPQMGLARRLRRVSHIMLLLCAHGLVPVIAAEQQRSEPLMVAVAANFAGPGQRLADIFTQGSGVPVELIVGATGLLHAQIVQGAPFDLLLAADTQRPLALLKDGLAADGSYGVYALGRLALWVPAADPSPDPMALLAAVSVLAHANPKLAPYGAAAAAVAQRVPEPPAGRRLVLGQNVAATFTQVASGAVPAGLVAYSQLLAASIPTREYSLIPASWHPPIAQALVLTRRGAARSEAWDFQRFLLSEQAGQLLLAMGYRAPETEGGSGGN